jgi:uncharacterized YigZ family protein
MEFEYCTLAGRGEGLLKDRGSKFLAFASPVASAGDIKSILQALKKEHPKAVHHCYAWRMGTNGTEHRAVDDGEPQGSAGKPILGQIDSAGVTNSLVVVVRYFGGTLLGVPGLIAAYKGSAALAIEAAGTRVKQVEQPIELELDYPAMGEVLYTLRLAGAQIYEQDQGLFCRIKAGIPLKAVEECVAKLRQIGRVRIEGTEKIGK